MVTFLPPPPNVHTGRYSLSDQPGDGTLTITSALIGDSSLINCQATNDAGTITSDSVQLRVIGECVCVCVCV